MSEEVTIAAVPDVIPTPEVVSEPPIVNIPVASTDKKILISEIYACTQGEGVLVGVPSILIRTSTCNLRCRWKDPTTGSLNICDTPFTSWNADTNNPMTAQQIYDEVVRQATNDEQGNKRKNPITHVIISGGEPTLWGVELSELCLGFLVTGMHITIETNGTKYIEVRTRQKMRDKRIIDLTDRMLFSISPKLKSSTPFGTVHEKEHNKQRINTTVLEALLKRYPSYLKFVVSSDEDLEEIKDLQKILKLPNERIFLMPEGINREEIIRHGAKTNELAIANGYRYSPREHIILYDNKRKT